MNNYSRIYSHFNCCGNSKVSAKYFVDNLVMCENRVNTHTHTHTHTHILIARILQKISYISKS